MEITANETTIIGPNGELMQSREPIATEQTLAEESAKIGATQTLAKWKTRWEGIDS